MDELKRKIMTLLVFVIIQDKCKFLLHITYLYIIMIYTLLQSIVFLQYVCFSFLFNIFSAVSTTFSDYNTTNM